MTGGEINRKRKGWRRLSAAETKKKQALGPHTVGRRFCAVQAFSPAAKTLAQAEFISAEHFQEKGGGGFQPPKPKRRTSFRMSFFLVTRRGFYPRAKKPATGSFFAA